MAIMIPKETDREAFNESIGEERVYEALSCLPDDYYVFHSAHWSKQSISGRIRWGECDYLVYHPNFGMLVIEVKSGGIACRDGEWFQRNLRTREEKKLKRSPMRQAEESKYVFIDFLSDRNSDYISKLLIEPVVWFPSIDNRAIIESLPNDHTSSNVFLQDSLNRPEEAIKQAFKYYGMNNKLNPTKNDIKEVIDIFAPSFDVVQSSIGATEDRDYTFNRLTKEQGYLLDYLEEQKTAAIQGAGGTGKTMLALEKARRLSKEPVLFLCFNNLLLNHLRDTHKDIPNISFHNLYSLCNQKTFHDHIDEATILDFLNSYDKYGWNYKHIIVDEGQDFSNEQLGLLNAIADLNQGCFYVFYDKNQLVQRFEENDWFNSVDCRLILNKNCRNTFEIASTSYRAIDLDKVNTKTIVSGEKPRLHLAKTDHDILNIVANIIKNYTNLGYLKKQITILTLKTEETSVLNGTNIVAKNDITFTTARKFKGLESDIVIIVDMDKTAFENLENKRLFYVASSRAKHYLDIVSNLNEEDIATMVRDLEGESRKQARLALGLTLKVKVTNC